jgi:hypothetical protein
MWCVLTPWAPWALQQPAAAFVLSHTSKGVWQRADACVAWDLPESDLSLFSSGVCCWGGPQPSMVGMHEGSTGL